MEGVVFIVNLTILVVYLPLLITMMCKVRLQLSAFVVVMANLLCFLPKALEDGLRLYSVDSKWQSVLPFVITVADRLRILMVYFFIKQIDEFYQRLLS
jgi:hypothetical protein